MPILTPEELTQTEIDYISQFGKNYEVRVKMFRNETSNIFDLTPIAHGAYSATTGIYTLTERAWIKKIVFIVTQGYVGKVEYKDQFGNWIVWETEYSYSPTPKYSIFAKELRISTYNPCDPTDILIPGADPYLMGDTWFDITPYIVGEIQIENNIGDLTGEVKLPYVSIRLDNKDGFWNKNSLPMLDRYEIIFGNFNNKISTAPMSKSAGIKLAVEIRFFGPNWEVSSWILIATFYSRKFTTTDLSGESAWVAKTAYDVSTIEGATFFDLIDRFIVREKGKMLLQVQNNFHDEIITITKEHVGSIELEPFSPEKILDGIGIMSHCTDDKYIYYAKKVAGTQANTDSGGYIDIRKVTKSGSQDQRVGVIYAVPLGSLLINSIDEDFTGNFWIDADPTLNGNSSVRRMIRGVYGIAADDEYLYISCLSVINGTYHAPVGYWYVWQFEPYILKLPKNGLGWEAICGNLVEENGVNDFSDPYSNSNKWSLGYNGNWYSATPATYDPYDVLYSGNYVPIIRNLSLFNDNGTEKLLFIKELQRKGDKAVVMSEYWIIGKDWSSPTKIGNEGTTKRVECILPYSDVTFFVHWSEWSAGATSARKLGVLSRKNNGDFYIDNYGSADVTEWFYCMSMLNDGIYASGNNFDGGINYQPNQESFSLDGIKQKYLCTFILDGFNIIDHRHTTRNKYLSFPTPEIYVAGGSINFDIARYAKEQISGDVLSTLGWVMDLRNGIITMRQIYPSGELFEVYASYDFLRSIMFYEGKGPSRLGSGALQSISEAFGGNVYIDETGSLKRLPFIESQAIPVSHIINDYSKVSMDNGQSMYGSIPGIALCHSYTDPDDILVSFQFTPEYDCILEKINVPIKLAKIGSAALNPTYDIPLDLDIYITNSGINYATSDGLHPTTPPTSASIELLLTTSLYIGYDKIDPNAGVYGESEYYWIVFNVSSANKNLTANTRYGIILRTQNHNDIIRYFAIGKMVDNANCRTIYTDIADSGIITSMPSSNWHVAYESPLYRSVMLTQIITIKKKQELRSTKIIDSLNPNITTGFDSNLFEANTAISVFRDELYTSTYGRGTDYIISYSAGKFWIEFIGALSDSSSVAYIIWFESDFDLLTISDVGTKEKSNNILTKFSEFGDDTTYYRIIIDGKKLLPSPANIVIYQDYELHPGILSTLEASTEQTKMVEISSVYQWNDSNGKYEPVELISSDSMKFTLEFKDPFIIGTTEYIVRYGKGHSNGANPNDPIEDGTISMSSGDDTPRFYEVVVTSFLDANYHVLIKNQEAYKEWRLAVVNDFQDMDSDTVEGTVPAGPSEIFTKDHFYIKHMNRGFGFTSVDWLAYTSEERKFFIDKNGIVIRDDTFSSSSILNPIPSAYPSKKIYVLIEPMDFGRNPLFEKHAEVGYTGYDIDMLGEVNRNLAVDIERVTIQSRGLSILFSNYGTYKKFLKVTIIGYPINFLTTIKSEKRKTGYDHADAKYIQITNDLIQSSAIANRMSSFMMLFWGNERVNFRKEVVYDPRFRPGSVVKVTSEEHELDNNLFYITSTNCSISATKGLTITLDKLLQI
jgi:hypothetical protein